MRYLLALVLVSFVAAASAQEWTRFRGPNGSGVSDATTIPVTWTDRDYNWQVDLPGKGLSSPVVWRDRVFVTAADDQKLERRLLCYKAADGGLAWSRVWAYEKEKKHARNSYASNTPAVDEERVYAIWQSHASSQVVALDHEGRDVWQFDLGPFASNHGGGTSPIVVGDLLVLNNNQEGDASFLLALDRRTGEQRWRIPRDRVKATYSTPCVYRNAAGKDELIFTSWQHGITSVNPATGKVNWEKDVFEHDQEKRAIGSPLIAGDLVLGTCGFTAGKKYLVALRPDAARPAEVQEIYRLDRIVNHMPTALVHGPLLFLWNDGGVVTCAKADDGQTVWQKRVGGNYSGSPVCVNSKLYAMSDDGELVVLAAADKFEELGRVKLPEGSSSTPAVSGGVMYLRTFSKLLSIGGRKL